MSALKNRAPRSFEFAKMASTPSAPEKSLLFNVWPLKSAPRRSASA